MKNIQNEDLIMILIIELLLCFWNLIIICKSEIESKEKTNQIWQTDATKKQTSLEQQSFIPVLPTSSINLTCINSQIQLEQKIEEICKLVLLETLKFPFETYYSIFYKVFLKRNLFPFSKYILQ